MSTNITACRPLSLDAAHEHVHTRALRADDGLQRVGLELEFHLVDLARPAVRPSWAQVTALVTGLPSMPSGSLVTTEPGGQLELSAPPAADVAAAIAGLRADVAVLRDAAAAAGYGLAAIGTDPARPARRINPAPRYAAMQRHFQAVGCLAAGSAMMTSSAALQLNLDAGPAAGWADRLRHLHRLGPVLVAASACSPHLAGTATGWASSRQRAWGGIDDARTAACVGDDPAGDWARYALAAPVMLVRDADGGAEPVTDRVPFAAWADGSAPLGRPPTVEDLDYHLTTLFPPVRLRGYLEVRYLDAVPDRWWPGLATLVATLADDPVAADRSAAAVEPVADAWTTAARDGLRDPAVRRAVLDCVRAALERCDAAGHEDLTRLAALLESGRTPGDDLRGATPLDTLTEESRG